MEVFNAIHHEPFSKLQSKTYELEQERIVLQTKLKGAENDVRRSSNELERLNPWDPQHGETKALINERHQQIAGIIRKISQIEESKNAVNAALKSQSHFSLHSQLLPIFFYSGRGISSAQEELEDSRLSHPNVKFDHNVIAQHHDRNQSMKRRDTPWAGLMQTHDSPSK